ncbi:MAG TPA: uroporphyrinogen-III synthase, partial [Prosthecobacter sp.]|nr:uroporphyrinogen-III synthase [Prosthecobacter sp.]
EKDENLEAIARFVNEGADWITFTSASTVEHFLALNLKLPEGLKIASIGPVTSDTIRKHGLTITVEAKEHTIPGLADAVVRHSGAGKGGS